MNRLLTFTIAALLAGCASAPPPRLTATSPASPTAPEGARVARQTSLRSDDATSKTHALLTAAQKEQEHWDAYGPVSGNPDEAPKSNAKPEMKHEHH